MSKSIQRVLVVDDDINLCESIRDYLAEREDEYKFLGGVWTYSAAIELFRDGMPNIVILDMMLGNGLDGSDLVEEFRKIEKEQGFKTYISVFSKSLFYESYCVQNNLMFTQKGAIIPEIMINRIERFVGLKPSGIQPVKINVTPPKTRRERMQEYLFSAFSNVGAHTYTAYDDCLYIIPRMIELTEAGIEFAMEQIYKEWEKKCKASKSAIEGRIANMLKSLWSKASLDALEKFYPPDLGKGTAPTPVPFITYYVKRLMQVYPENVEKIICT